ncbi:MAG: ammonia-forming cytochrome c nitrite reductase subunit c552 [Planctomycetota bacterium]
MKMLLRFVLVTVRNEDARSPHSSSLTPHPSPLIPLWFMLAVVPAVAAGADAVSPPPAGSQLAPDENACLMCHGEADLWEDDTLRLHMPAEKFADDVHWQKGVNCHDCHGGDPTVFDAGDLHAAEDGFRALKDVRKACANCHEEQLTGLGTGVHAKVGPADDSGRGTPMGCAECHGDNPHLLYGADDSRSPVFLDHQVRLCGACHGRSFGEYEKSVHGHGLEQSGLLVTAVCADCHGAHGILPAEDERSTLHTTNVAGTCAKCHRFVEERLDKSVHGGGNGPGGATDEPASGGTVKRKPSCTDCHFGHDLPHPKSALFRQRLSDRCGNCHENLSQEYGMSLHGALTQLGYWPAAKCSDCHGSHDILPVSDPASRLARGENRLATCKKCHPHAVANFCDFNPHADHRDAERYPLLHYTHLGMELLIFSVFTFFGVHTLLWFVRSLVHVRRHGRPVRLAVGSPAYVRFEPIHRVLHAIVIVSFLGLALTGLPLKYSDQAWAGILARALGGFDSTRVWHHICAVLTVFYFTAHLVWMARRVVERWIEGVGVKELAFGPDSPIPNVRDAQDMFRMFRWFLGLGPKPVFERWTYWEKFDYWAVFWGVGIIGTSGLILWFPNFFSMVLPGEALNIAKVIHSEEALLATSFIFAIHFFGTHFRPEKFPIDMSILTGLVSEEDLEEERPEFLARMREAGKLDELRGTGPTRGVFVVISVAGSVALLIGLCLLVGIIVSVLGG